MGEKIVLSLIPDLEPIPGMTHEESVEAALKSPWLQPVHRFAHEVAKESDRGRVIVAQAFLDDVLGVALHKKLKSIANANDKAVDFFLTDRPMPPLGAFSIRTKMALVLGIIDQKTKTALDCLRDMRNDAAHLTAQFSLESWRKKLNEFIAPLSKKEQALFKILSCGEQESPWHLFWMVSLSLFLKVYAASLDRSFLPAGAGAFDSVYDHVDAQLQVWEESNSRSTEAAIKATNLDSSDNSPHSENTSPGT